MDATVALELAGYVASRPLAPCWSEPECFSDVATVGRRRIRLVGLVARSARGAEVTGSAAALDASPVSRAHCELLERATLVDALASHRPRYELLSDTGKVVGSCSAALAFPQSPAGASWSYARSNGVAAGRDWRSACRAARLELTERDRVLRSWYGETCPLPMEARGSTLAGLAEHYRIVRYAFPAGHAEQQAGIHVVGVFAFPKRATIAFAYGLGASSRRAAALAKAELECLQGIGFLWGEAVPEQLPVASCTPSFHQEYYLVPETHAKLEAWLGGAHTRSGSALEARARSQSAPCFVDLTPEHLRGRLAIAKAIPAGQVALTFGLGHPWQKSPLPADLAVHPIA
jgi:hypothetical protein